MLLTPKIELLNEDNMAVMARYPDGYFDLAIVDPPYGINFGEFNRTNKTSNGTRVKANKYKNSNWDSGVPNNEYFKELQRVSKHQIIWGGDYFLDFLGSTQCFIFWYKQNPVDNFSDGEMAWTSFSKPASCFNYRYYGNLEGNTSAPNKIHPTQKPIQLYNWLLEKYAQPDFKILDTHLGSGSIAIAAHYFGCELVGTEIDKDYYKAAIKRFKEQTAQTVLF